MPALSDLVAVAAARRDDPAVRALEDLRLHMERTVLELGVAAARLEQLAELRAAGRSWHDIVSSEDRPLVVETVSRVLDELTEIGSRFRREEALALRTEGVSLTRIAQLFGVSRQRVSAIVRDREADEAGSGRSVGAGEPQVGDGEPEVAQKR